MIWKHIGVLLLCLGVVNLSGIAPEEDSSTEEGNVTVTTSQTDSLAISLLSSAKEINMETNQTVEASTKGTKTTTLPLSSDEAEYVFPTTKVLPLLKNIPGPFEIVYPTIKRKNQGVKSTLEPRSRHKEHFQHVSLLLRFNGKKYKLQLQLNEELLSKRIEQKHYLHDNTQVILKDIEHCYYHGYVRKTFQSSVAISTCDGIRGVIHLENETFVIQPVDLKESVHDEKKANAHVIFKSPVGSGKHACGNKAGQWQPYSMLHRGEYLRRMKTAKSKNREKRQLDKRDVLTETKYIELALVLDHSLFVSANISHEEAMKYALQVGNMVDMYYQKLNTRAVITYVELWNAGNKFKITDNIRQTLQRFMIYRQDSMRDREVDVAHLITGQVFSDEVSGMAIPDSVCTDRAVGISVNSDPSQPHQVASTLAHMIGHNLGIQHDSGDRDCVCSEATNCIMGSNIMDQNGHSPSQFSVCSEEHLDRALETGLGYCLFNNPKESTFPQYCGNGILERGEECDCGPPDVCRQKDPCCEPSTCLLKSWAKCKSGPCCHNCTVKTTSQICRPATSECDVPEFCDGINGECPPNAYVQDGYPCQEGTAYCFHSHCPTRDGQCATVWGTGAKSAKNKCYEAFNPTGNFNGHCGMEADTGKFIRCDTSNVLCGLLHCQGGASKPQKGELAFMRVVRTMYMDEGSEYECKVASGPPAADLTDMGMVTEGTKCGPSQMCINHICVDTRHILKHKCPIGLKNLTCSGNGVCTNENKCYCKEGFQGPACSIKLETEAPKPSTTMKPPSFIEDPGSTFQFPATTNATDQLAQTKTSMDTILLIVILASVVGVLVVIFLFIMFCYRRRTPAALKIKTSLFIRKKTMSSKRSESSDDNSVRIIKFGNMPSYRQDKMEERKRKKTRRTGSTVGSGSDVEGAQSDDATEIKVVHNNLSKTPERGILKKGPRSSDDLNNLGNKSDEGGRSSVENRKGELSPSDNEIYGASDESKNSPTRRKMIPPSHSKDNFDFGYRKGSPFPVKRTPSHSSSKNSLKSDGSLSSPKRYGSGSPVFSREKLNDLRQSPLLNGPPKRSSTRERLSPQLSPKSVGSMKSSSSRDEIYQKSAHKRSTSSDSVPKYANLHSPGMSRENSGISPENSDLEQVQKSPQKQKAIRQSRSRDSLRSGEKRKSRGQERGVRSPQDVGTIPDVGREARPKHADHKHSPRSTSKSRIIKIRNIDDLLKEIDDHEAKTHANLSPATSEDFRCSEPEADRHYHRNYQLNPGQDTDCSHDTGLGAEETPRSSDCSPDRAGPYQFKLASPSANPCDLESPSNRNSLSSGSGAFKEFSPVRNSFRDTTQSDHAPFSDISVSPHNYFKPVSPDQDTDWNDPVSLSSDENQFQPPTPPKMNVKRVSPEYGVPGARNQFRPIQPARISYDNFSDDLPPPPPHLQIKKQGKSKQQYV